ncbi:MAG: CPBP family intramembrane metalloprotease [Planctomycetes bacterium]|nr:CPBP family intramembrane metalloprotease [Planctomycetota bacterium]
MKPKGAGLFGSDAKPTSYAALSTRPLYVLCFLLPFMVLYEVGSFKYLRDSGRGVIETIGARKILAGFFETFGIASFHIPPLVLCAVLIVWHVLLGDAWKIKGRVIVGMALESVLWTLPLLVFALTFFVRRPPAFIGAEAFADLSMPARLTLSAGAGVYEELLFRLIIISVVHFIVVDLLQGSRGVGYTMGGVISAVAFAMAHNISHPGGGTDLGLFAYYALAGLYFAGLFVFRGFGMVVATHALFDAVVLVAIPSATAR